MSTWHFDSILVLLEGARHALQNVHLSAPLGARYSSLAAASACTKLCTQTTSILAMQASVRTSVASMKCILEQHVEWYELIICD